MDTWKVAAVRPAGRRLWLCGKGRHFLPSFKERSSNTQGGHSSGSALASACSVVFRV